MPCSFFISLGSCKLQPVTATPVMFFCEGQCCHFETLIEGVWVTGVSIIFSILWHWTALRSSEILDARELFKFWHLRWQFISTSVEFFEIWLFRPKPYRITAGGYSGWLCCIFFAVQDMSRSRGSSNSRDLQDMSRSRVSSTPRDFQDMSKSRMSSSKRESQKPATLQRKRTSLVCCGLISNSNEQLLV